MCITRTMINMYKRSKEATSHCNYNVNENLDIS